MKNMNKLIALLLALLLSGCQMVSLTASFVDGTDDELVYEHTGWAD